MPPDVRASAVILIVAVASTAMAVDGWREGGRPGRPVVWRRVYDGGEVQGSGTRRPRPALEWVYSECPSRPAAGDGLHGGGEAPGARAQRPRPARERVYSECPSWPTAGDGLQGSPSEPPAEEEEGRFWAKAVGPGVQDPGITMAIPRTKDCDATGDQRRLEAPRPAPAPGPSAPEPSAPDEPEPLAPPSSEPRAAAAPELPAPAEPAPSASRVGQMATARAASSRQ
ncbi:predicted GPI-anchored protein 58 [Phragmites australis]|uniref:predicted GPI-anchored protein 58 n=1 Tax=Phragmites australis TaxID=29695 RepID=UPI002D78EEB4|nr:predicted GPI-anchored protein 58 [Phragmites australis]